MKEHYPPTVEILEECALTAGPEMIIDMVTVYRAFLSKLEKSYQPVDGGWDASFVLGNKAREIIETQSGMQMEEISNVCFYYTNGNAICLDEDDKNCVEIHVLSPCYRARFYKGETQIYGKNLVSATLKFNLC